MPADFLDTSALAKRYHTEAGSAEVDRLWTDPTHGLFVSRLSALEIVSVFAAKVRAGVISIADFDALRGRFAADMSKTRRLGSARLTAAHFQEAERLLRERGLTHRLRTLDALQLAVALDLRGKGLVQRVVSADRDLLQVAAAEGFSVFDPEHP